MTVTAAAEPGTVPRLWPGSTVVCLCPGPSLTAADVAFACGRAKTIAVNRAVEVAPAADVLYSSDQYFVRACNGWQGRGGLKFVMEQDAKAVKHFAPWPDLVVLRNTGEQGLESQPHGLRTGQNSGYAAINLAVHLGATTIVLLGYDMAVGPKGQRYFDGTGRQQDAQYAIFRRHFDTLVQPLTAAGIAVVNASRQTALTAFRRLPLEEALS